MSEPMPFAVGNRVEIRQYRPGGSDSLHGTSTVASVSGNVSCKLADGSRWRRDGYAWGSSRERGIGRAHQRRIVKVNNAGAGTSD
jgi:hypothetical protein